MGLLGAGGLCAFSTVVTDPRRLSYMAICRDTHFTSCTCEGRGRHSSPLRPRRDQSTRKLTIDSWGTPGTTFASRVATHVMPLKARHSEGVNPTRLVFCGHGLGAANAAGLRARRRATKSRVHRQRNLRCAYRLLRRALGSSFTLSEAIVVSCITCLLNSVYSSTSC